MRPYVSDFINTLSGRRSERIAVLLREARAGKKQLPVLVRRLDEEYNEDFAPLVLSEERPNSFITIETFQSAARNLGLHVGDLFRASELISTMLATHAASLRTEVKVAEDELMAMEKMVNNFAFLLSDNQTYDFAHLEPFSDESDRELMKNVPDRGGLPDFGPAENATVIASEGVLVLPDEPSRDHALTGRIVKGNATSFVIDDSGLENALKKDSTTGWRMVVAAAGPVVKPFKKGLGLSGAQVWLEFTLSNPAPCSRLSLVPYANLPIELLNFTIYSGTEDSQGTEIINTARKITGPFTFRFPMQKVARFRILLNQPTYTRVVETDITAERRYSDMLRRTRQNILDRSRTKLNNILKQFQVNERNSEVPLKGPDMPTAGAGNSSRRRRRRPIGNQHLVKDIMVQRKEISNLERLLRGERFEGRRDYTPWWAKKQFDPKLPNRVHGTHNRPVITGFQYQYIIGLHNVSVAPTRMGERGVFVSSPMESPGDIGRVRLKTSETQHMAVNSSRNSLVMSSVEYAVSNRAEPVNESDWIPILPVGTTEVTGERFIPNHNGFGRLRFRAEPAESFYLYKNGYTQRISAEMMVYDQHTSSLIGLRIPPNSYDSNDIFTIDYRPVSSVDSTTIRFQGFDMAPLVSAYDANGVGEGFKRTGARNSVDLSRPPYVGTTVLNQGGSPIVVQLPGGTTATNYTNYTGGPNTPLPTTDGYYYHHSGSTLIFNRAIKAPFRVHYQYLQNNVRVRVVLRSNSLEYASPKVDFYHLKGKVRRAS